MMVFDILRYIIGTYVTNKVSNAFDDIYMAKVFKVLAFCLLLGTSRHFQESEHALVAPWGRLLVELLS